MIGGSAAAAVMWWVVAQTGATAMDGGVPADGGVPPDVSLTAPAPAEDGGAPPAVPVEAVTGDADGGVMSVVDPGDGGTAEVAPSPAPEEPVKKSRPPKPTKKNYLKRPNTVAVNAVSAIFGLYAFSFERAFAAHVSVILEAMVINRQFATPRGTTTVGGFGFGVSGRYFPFGNAPEGLWAGPEFTTYNLEVREQAGRDRGTSVALGLAGGYSFTFFKWLHVAPGVGGELVLGPVAPRGIQFHYVTFGDEQVNFGWNGKLRLNVGAAF